MSNSKISAQPDSRLEMLILAGVVLEDIAVLESSLQYDGSECTIAIIVVCLRVVSFSLRLHPETRLTSATASAKSSERQRSWVKFSTARFFRSLMSYLSAVLATRMCRTLALPEGMLEPNRATCVRRRHVYYPASSWMHDVVLLIGTMMKVVEEVEKVGR